MLHERRRVEDLLGGRRRDLARSSDTVIWRSSPWPSTLRAALEAGRHVHTEKPLALRYDDARALVALAEARGVRDEPGPPGDVASRPTRDRVHRDGWSFTREAPDWVTATMEHEDGVVTRLTASFWVPASKQGGLELHGDEGSLFLATWADFDSRLELQPRGDAGYMAVPLVREPSRGIDWSRALLDRADAIERERRHRSTGEHAAHVVAGGGRSLGRRRRALRRRALVLSPARARRLGALILGLS